MNARMTLGIAIAAAIGLSACSKHGDNQATPADAAGNLAGDDAANLGAPDANAAGLDANAADAGNALDANLAGANAAVGNAGE